MAEVSNEKLSKKWVPNKCAEENVYDENVQHSGRCRGSQEHFWYRQNRRSIHCH